ncbi:MAG: sensor histidine kinase [Bryobacteraceae bacterium]
MMKVVMIDDSQADRRLFRFLLEDRLGSRLEFWEDGTAAKGLNTCRSVSPDCVLLDYKLPDMTGIEFLRQLQPNDPSEPPAFAVVMLTGLADEQVAIDAMKAGAQDYLVKDRMTPEALHSAILKASEKVGLFRSLKRERDRLAASLVEKEVLLKEVHHRVKNNLQVIASLLRLQANAMESSMLAGALRESQNRVESMALIHEQLYEAENLREVDLAKHASLLLGNLFQSHGVDPARISGRVSVDPLPLGIDRAIPAGLILNELVSNALKHAFPGERRGSISIEGTSRAGEVDLVVRDDGVGLPAGPPRPHSLGLQIVQTLTRQLKGDLQIESHPGAGAAFRVRFLNS